MNATNPNRKLGMLDSFSFALRYNNTLSRCRCPVCGHAHEPAVGLWPFLGEPPAADAVCMSCAKFHTCDCPEWYQPLNLIEQTIDSVCPSPPSPPVYRIETTGAGEAVVTFTDGDGAGQRNAFCGDLEILMDLMCCTYGGPLTAHTAAHNALGQSIKNAIEAFREINAAHQREASAKIDRDLDSEIPF